MKYLYRLCIACACIAGGINPQVILASPISITSNNIYSYANDVTTDSAHFNGITIPAYGVLTATIGNSSSVTNYDYDDTTSSAMFSYVFSHSIDNTTGDTSTGDYAASYATQFYFTADTSATYSIDGYYSMVGPSGTRTFLEVYLQDLSTGYLFYDKSLSQDTANETFIAGDILDGDYSNQTIGSLMGNLVNGHTYSFQFVAYIQAENPVTNPIVITASSGGEVNLVIEAVPIPATVWLFGSGLLGLIGISPRKKTA